MKINEISIIDELVVKHDYSNLVKESKKIGKDGNIDILRYDVPNENQIMLFAVDKQKQTKAYLVVEEKSGYIWAEELKSFESGKKYGTNLLSFAVKYFQKLMIDRELSVQSATMIEKLIKNKIHRASIVDVNQGTITTYNPDKDYNIPMYDSPVPGIDRPLLKTDEAYRFTWMLENLSPRTGVLNQYIRIDESIKTWNLNKGLQND